MNMNIALNGINTDYEITTILGNFSEDFIIDTIKTSLEYRFRPYGLRSPNYPEILNHKLDVVRAKGPDFVDAIEEHRVETMQTIIDTICEFYNLENNVDIPDQEIYTAAYYMYQIFCSEFTDRMIYFFANFIILNEESIINGLTPEQKQIRTMYAKKVFNNQNLMIIYDNMSSVLELVASYDIDLHTLLVYLSDQKIADFLCQYIVDINDIYKYYFASLLLDESTRADMLSAIRLKFTSLNAQNQALFNPNTNPYIIDPMLK